MGFYTPRKLIILVREATEHDAGIYFAVLFRLVLGVALMVAASASRFPLAFLILGGLTIFAAVGLPFFGQARILGLIDWFERLPDALTRAWLLFGTGFGAFLIYGVTGGPA